MLIRSSIKVGIFTFVIDRGNGVEEVSGERKVPGDEVESRNQILGMVDMVVVKGRLLLLAMAMALALGLELSHNNGGRTRINGPFFSFNGYLKNGTKLLRVFVLCFNKTKITHTLPLLSIIVFSFTRKPKPFFGVSLLVWFLF